MRNFLFLVNTILPWASAAPVAVESLDVVPRGWEEVRSPAPTTLIKLSIGLQSDNHESFERAIFEIADPDHANYGRHLSSEEAKALLKPLQEASDSVKRWLCEAGIPEHQVRDDGQWLHVRTTVDQAEGLLSARFGVYARDQEHIVRTLEYSVPAEIRGHIESIQPTTFFHAKKRSEKTTRSPVPQSPEAERGGRGSYGNVNLNQCKSVLTPACIRKIYKIPNDYAKAHKKSLYGIVGFHGQAAQFSQLEEFLKRFAPDQKGSNFSVALVNGGLNPQETLQDVLTSEGGIGKYPSGEANLDIQYAVSLAYQVPVRYISVGGENFNFNPDLDLPKLDPKTGSKNSIEPWLEFATYLLNAPEKDLPQVVSISYGENEQEVPKAYAKQVCNMFGQIGARGVSLIVASGDSGPGSACQTNDGKNTTRFLPGFPAGCPYVTSVGGTENNSPETAIFFTGGGFSEYWSRPNWQDKAVKKYLDKHGSEFKRYYNKDGRAIPDVAALAWNHQIMNHFNQSSAGGTSAAAPVFGAIVAVLNDERFKKGKPALGFLNPFIYKNGEVAFTDITQGKSVGCEGSSHAELPSSVVPNAGWQAVKGWDPATGWGTPLFDRLKKLAT